MKSKPNNNFTLITALVIPFIARTALSQPTITAFTLSAQGQTAFDQPPNGFHHYRNFSISPGALVYFGVTVSGSGPFSYQWQLNAVDLPGETNNTLGYPGAALAPGSYTIAVTDGSNATTTQTANLSLDSTFTKIVSDPIVTNTAWTTGGTWGDFDNDGYQDLFIWQGQDSNLSHAGAQLLFHNSGNGTFTQLTGVPPVNINPVYGTSACWGDYDNDGNLDLYVTLPVTNLLYHNNGSGTFSQITAGSIVTDSFNTYGAAWADYDQDGFLDLFVTTLDSAAKSHCFLYHNNGDGTFTSITNGPLVTDLASSSGCAWGDYDNDGKIDLFVCGGGASTPQPNRLYHNNGDGTFSRVTNSSAGSIISDAGQCKNAAWGDYDNDGFLDLFVSNGSGGNNFLYHNNGDGTFTRILIGPIALETGHNFVSGAWGDFDNDGFLDLYVTDEGISTLSPTVVNYLYHNNGDGTFSKITTGSPVNEYSDSLGCCWVDYDNDGFLDLFASRGDQRGSLLYHNNLPNVGNTNAWLTVRLIGTASNRSAIGAKVRVQSFYRGQSRWQLRQITGGSGTSGHNELQANFGLGDATNVDTLRIEWPSGTVQEFQNVAPKQILSITEPPRLLATTSNGLPQFSLKGGRFIQYIVQASADLSDPFGWNRLGLGSVVTATNMSGTIDLDSLPLPAGDLFHVPVVDDPFGQSGSRYYRVLLLPGTNQLAAISAAYQANLGNCRNFDGTACEECLRTFFQYPVGSPAEAEEAADIAIGLGSQDASAYQTMLLYYYETP